MIVDDINYRVNFLVVGNRLFLLFFHMSTKSYGQNRIVHEQNLPKKLFVMGLRPMTKVEHANSERESLALVDGHMSISLRPLVSWRQST